MTSFAQKSHDVRLRKAATIAAILEDHVDLSNCDVLEIGTGAGIISKALAQRAKSLSSVDVNDERVETEGFTYLKLDGAALPFDDASFDIVLSNQVIEHIPDQDLHLAESFRVVRPEGLVYMATPNRLWPKEVHSQIWFLGWLPRALASRVYRAKRRKEWDVFPLTYFALSKRLKDLASECGDFVPVIIKNSAKFEFKDSPGVVRLLDLLPLPLVKLLSFLMPSFIFLCRPKRVAKRA